MAFPPAVILASFWQSFDHGLDVMDELKVSAREIFGRFEQANPDLI
jgi:hypothetical protein